MTLIPIYIFHLLLILVLKLHRRNAKPVVRKVKDPTNSHIPLSMESIISSKQTSFDDSICHTTHSHLLNDHHNHHSIESDDLPNILTSKSSSSYHTYKYSRREQKRFYASVARARLKKHNPISRRTRPLSPIFEQGNYLIILPTIITSRQRLNTNASNSFPLLFDPNFQTLVQKSTHEHLLEKHFSMINTFFQLLHSIASQEFQTIVYSNDNQHQVSYTAFSFLHLLRQTMSDYTINLQKTLKRNYFQTFQQHNLQPMTSFKTPRYESSTSQIHIENQHQPMRVSTSRIVPSTPIIENFIPIEQDRSDQPSRLSDLMFDDDDNDQPTTEYVRNLFEKKPPTIRLI